MLRYRRGAQGYAWRVAKRITGTLRSWNDDRGFGFLTPNGVGSDVFVHISSFPAGSHRPKVGDVISYTVGTNPQGKTFAQDVEPRSAPRFAKRSRPFGAAGFVAVIGFIALFVIVATQWPLPLWVSVTYIGSSIVAIIIYGLDKQAATAGHWRVSESTLLGLGLVGGWPGAIVAQEFFHHKTNKPAFRAAFWLTVVVNVAVFTAFATPLLRYLLPELAG